MPKAYLTPPKLAEHWGCSPETVLSHVKSGRLRAFTLSKPGSKRPRWRIPLDAVAEFENRQGVKPETKAKRRKRESNPEVIEFFT